MGRFYRPESKPEKPADTVGQVGPEGRFYLPPTEAPEEDVPAEDVDFEATGPNEQASVLAGDPPEESVHVEQPAGNATREEWAAYARTQGASDADLVDEDGKDVGRDALREKYGSASS